MPKKSWEDGRIASEAEAEKMAMAWDTYSQLRDLAKQGKRLLQDVKGGDTVLANLANLKLNKLVFLELAMSMASRGRLSADPMDTLILMCSGWYSLHKKDFQEVQGFEVQNWSFKDAWTMHKTLTILRQKVVKDECPRELQLPYCTRLAGVDTWEK